MAHKHYQLIVPNYDQSNVDEHGVVTAEGAPLSYLRLGGPFDDTDPTEPLNTKHKRGDTLVEGMEFKDDWRSPTYPDKPYTRDDEVRRQTTGHTAKSLTQEVMSRGGIREHTDGNRISTTRGDHFEVIQGNYKLVVLGRVAASWDPSGLGDAGNSNNVGRTRQEVSSGGHYNESTSTPGEVVSITWSEREDGTFETVEQTDGGDVKSIYKGWKREEYYGPRIEENVGLGTSDHAIEQARGTGMHPTSADGHDAKKPDITEKTYARSIQSAVHVEEIDDKTEAHLHIMEKTHVKKALTELETCKDKTSLGFAVFFNETLCATNHFVKDGFLEWRRNYTFGGIDFSFGMIGLDLIKAKGFGISISLTRSLSIDITGFSLSVQSYFFTNVRIAPRLEVSLGNTLDPVLIHLDAPLSSIKSHLSTMRTAAVKLKTHIKNTRLNASSDKN